VESKGAVFWLPLLLAIALAESYRVGLGWAEPRSSKFNQLRDDYEMGNLGFDPLGLLPEDPKERKDMQSKELNNGRLAMIAIAAFVAQELVSKDEIFEHVRPCACCASLRCACLWSIWCGHQQARLFLFKVWDSS